MTRFLCGAVAVGVLLATTAAPEVGDEPVEAAVYRAALGAVTFEAQPSSLRRHALVASTFDPGGLWRGLDEGTIKAAPYLDPKHRLTYAKAETVDAFLAAIETEKPLPKELGSLTDFLLIERRELRALVARRQWAAFERRRALAPGTVEVSRIGFDASASQALVYVEFSCGSLCGSGTFVLLEREAAGWRVVKVDGYMES